MSTDQLTAHRIAEMSAARAALTRHMRNADGRRARQVTREVIAAGYADKGSTPASALRVLNGKIRKLSGEESRNA